MKITDKNTSPAVAHKVAGPSEPDVTRLARLEENLGAVAVELRSDDLREIESTASKITIQGARYPEHIERQSNR